MKEIKAKERRDIKKKIVVPILLQFFFSSHSHAHFDSSIFSGLILRVAPDCIRPLSAIRFLPAKTTTRKAKTHLFFFQDIQSVATSIITSTKIRSTISNAWCPLPRPQGKPAVGLAYRVSYTHSLTHLLTWLTFAHSLTHSTITHSPLSVYTKQAVAY